MASITIGGNAINTSGELPEIGIQAPDFKLVATDLSTKTLNDFKSNNLILNIFPSVDTGVCDATVRKFNEKVSDLNNTKVLCISRDLPFRQEQYCGAAGLNNVVMLSDFKNGDFGKNYGLIMTNGIFDGLLSRCVIVLDKNGVVVYSQQVPEIGTEPNYDSALKAVENL